MINLNDLKQFIYESNVHGYANNSQKLATSQRPGFKELEFRKDDWHMRDSYAGHLMAPGQTVIYFKNTPIWSMSYSGGMKEIFHNNFDFTHQTYKFLKEALLKSDKNQPYRGPSKFQSDDWEYIFHMVGDIKDFFGSEKILYKNQLVFEQNIIGGLII